MGTLVMKPQITPRLTILVLQQLTSSTGTAISTAFSESQRLLQLIRILLHQSMLTGGWPMEPAITTINWVSASALASSACSSTASGEETPGLQTVKPLLQLEMESHKDQVGEMSTTMPRCTTSFLPATSKMTLAKTTTLLTHIIEQ